VVTADRIIEATVYVSARLEDGAEPLVIIGAAAEGKIRSLSACRRHPQEQAIAERTSPGSPAPLV
jgi:hypothetical protein